MKSLGLFIMLLWASAAYFLYPFPAEDYATYESFLSEERDTYLALLDQEQTAEYKKDPDKFIDERLAEGKRNIWIVWLLKLALGVSGLLAGFLAYTNRPFRLIVICSALIYLGYVSNLLSKYLPAWDLPIVLAYWMFLKRGNAFAPDSLLFQAIFYHQFLLFPLTLLALVGFCLFSWVRNSKTDFN